MKKTILLASFLPLKKIEWFIEFLDKNHNITIDKVFIFKNLEDDKYIITYKVELESEIKINFKKEFPFSTPIHKKGNVIYTINALNKLIEIKYNLPSGNICYKNYKINWSEYQDKIILIKDNNLIINNIERIFL
jgi:hypothetical protein